MNAHMLQNCSRLLFSPTHATSSWPAYSTDMSPMEPVWDLVGRRLARDPRPAASKDELLLRIQAITSDLSRQLSSATGTTVSRQTVCRHLGHIGLYVRRPVRCVPLTATHCRLRLTWSRKHALWTPQQWSCVMFSDESRFSLQSDSRRTLIWRAHGTRYHQENTIE
ncbi:transposable element Tcb1 transposase [Trichonephila clavipes]|nr:transposable element Tcb1 transposase [Trichonephila clavipes]